MQRKPIEKIRKNPVTEKWIRFGEESLLFPSIKFPPSWLLVKKHRGEGVAHTDPKHMGIKKKGEDGSSTEKVQSVSNQMSTMKHLIVFATLAASSCAFVNHIFSNGFMEEINRKAGNMWQAERGFHPQTSHSFLRSLMGVIKPFNGQEYIRIKGYGNLKLKDLPKEFDPRKKWPMCSSISDILDQGGCGSCWAFGAASAMSDRLCIHSGGNIRVRVSPENLLTCCRTCGFGCNGGYPYNAWSFWQEHGIVTGGKYGTSEGCQPYKIEPCEHHVNGSRPPCKAASATPKCHRFCENTVYTIGYDAAKTFGGKPFQVMADQVMIMRELMNNGPAETTFTVYEDFVNYKSGVYKHVHGSRLGEHAVRLLGWGEENGHPYWLLANSWNSDWGDKGTFKILRGSDECGIESSVMASIPKL